MGAIAGIKEAVTAAAIGRCACWELSAFSNQLSVGCNGFDNRYVIPDKILEECGITAQSEEDWKIEDFLQLRDQVFKYRYERIAVRRAAQEKFFKDNIAKLTAKS